MSTAKVSNQLIAENEVDKNLVEDDLDFAEGDDSSALPNQAERQNPMQLNELAVKKIQELEQNPDYVKLNFPIDFAEEKPRPFLFSKKQGSMKNQKFEFVLFYNEKEQRIKAVVYFGKHVQGPPNCVHGGAIASVLDGCLGAVIYRSNMKAVTVNLNVNYKKFIPLESTVLVETYIDNVQGRKIFANGVVKSLDESVVHNDCTSIFIRVDVQK